MVKKRRLEGNEGCLLLVMLFEGVDDEQDLLELVSEFKQLSVFHLMGLISVFELASEFLHLSVELFVHLELLSELLSQSFTLFSLLSQLVSCFPRILRSISSH